MTTARIHLRSTISFTHLVDKDNGNEPKPNTRTFDSSSILPSNTAAAAAGALVLPALAKTSPPPHTGTMATVAEAERPWRRHGACEGKMEQLF